MDLLFCQKKQVLLLYLPFTLCMLLLVLATVITKLESNISLGEKICVQVVWNGLGEKVFS